MSENTGSSDSARAGFAILANIVLSVIVFDLVLVAKCVPGSSGMTLPAQPVEFIRRFLMHVLPGGFHRIRHYGLMASGNRAVNIVRARQLLAMPARSEQQDTSEAPAADEPRILPRPCPCCGGRMFIIETFARGSEPKYRPTHEPAAIRIDTSWCRHRRSSTAPKRAIPAGSRPAAYPLAPIRKIGP